jgi:hypothetical protein
VSTGTPTTRAPSESEAIARSPRPTRVRSSVQLAAAASAHLDRRPADGDEAVAPDVAKRQRVGEDVARPREDRGEHRVDRERNGRDRGNPADRGAAREVGLHGEEVTARAGGDTHAEADDERDDEAPGAGSVLRNGSGTGGDEQRHEDAERDQLAVGEVDDPRDPVDHRIADGDEAVDAARRKTRDDDLEREAHVAQ